MSKKKNDKKGRDVAGRPVPGERVSLTESEVEESRKLRQAAEDLNMKRGQIEKEAFEHNLKVSAFWTRVARRHGLVSDEIGASNLDSFVVKPSGDIINADKGNN